MLDFLRRIASLCRKELLAILKDPANRVILVVPSLVESFLFGYAATFDLTNVPYAVLDQSRGAISTELIARLDGTGVFHRVATLRTPVRYRTGNRFRAGSDRDSLWAALRGAIEHR